MCSRSCGSVVANGARVLLGLAFFVGVMNACRPNEAAETGVAASTASKDVVDGDEAPVAPIVRDEATNLLFSFVDAQGRVQSVPRADAVPEPVRQRVLVIDLDKTPEQRQAHRFAFFADLTTKSPEGTYAVVAVSRYDAAQQATGPASTPPADGSVVVYSATWCGFCKKAKAWLVKEQVPFVERDVEKTPGAQAELDAKLKKAHVPGGGIPVIDWAGTLVVGFDVPSLQRLLREKPPSTSPSAGTDPNLVPAAPGGP
jgi:glutaredoxin